MEAIGESLSPDCKNSRQLQFDYSLKTSMTIDRPPTIRSGLGES